jgi:hypothetical protein
MKIYGGVEVAREIKTELLGSDFWYNNFGWGFTERIWVPVSFF